MSEITKEEKLSKLKKIGYEFPLRARIYLIRTIDGELKIIFSSKKETKKIENITFSELEMFHLDGSISTPLKVEDYKTIEDLENEIDQLRKDWGVE